MKLLPGRVEGGHWSRHPVSAFSEDCLRDLNLSYLIQSADNKSIYFGCLMAVETYDSVESCCYRMRELSVMSRHQQGKKIINS